MSLLSAPFRTSHVRKDNQVQAMLLHIDSARALYRIRYFEGERMISRTISASAKHFREKFA